VGDGATARPSFAALAIIVAVSASGCARHTTSSSPTEAASTAPSMASVAPTRATEEPLPVPEGATLLAVLDPEVVKPKVSAEEALALAAATMGMVGESPRIQLVRLAFRDPYSAFGPEWTGWIILSTDIPGSGFGGPYLEDPPPPQPSPVATYTWVHVAVDGEVMGASQTEYESPESVPSIPPEEPASR
jgi:hypothetical protein